MSNGSLGEKKEKLIGEIGGIKRKIEEKRRINSIVYTILILMGIGLSVGAAAAGFLDVAQTAGILALLAGTSVSLESAFKFGEKRDFFRIIASEYDNLQLALKYRVDTEKKLQLIVNKFEIVNSTSAKSLPRGKGMQVTKLLYEDLDRKGMLVVPEISGID